MRQKLGNARRGLVTVSLGLSVISLLFSYSGAAFAATQNVDNRARYFSAAAQEFGVPVQVLLAVSYNESRWTPHQGASSDNGFGIMDLRTQSLAQPQDGRGDPKRPAPTNRTIRGEHFTLDDATKLLHVSPKTLKNDEQQNIRGAAAVLAEYARKYAAGQLPANVGDWYDAISDYSGATDPQVAQSFADDVYATLQQGASLTTADGQKLSLAAENNLRPNRAKARATVNPSQQAADCPSTLNCRFIPAYYGQNNGNPADFGNYDPASRPNDMQINSIIIHDTEGSYQSAIDWFQNPQSYVSCNYVIRASDGAITEMVRPSDVAWCAGDWYVNMHSINIEHEGISAQGAAWYTESMYRASATLVRYLAAKYDIKLDRQHILGHDNVPTLSPTRMAGQHTDPGPYWDWNHYMDLLHGADTNGPNVNAHTKIITISPTFAANQPAITTCTPSPCATLPPQGSNIVYLHTQPNASSPLLSDRYMHSDNAPGTTELGDWSATAVTGEKFAVADTQGDWTAIWFGGKKGWFFNPVGNRTAHASHGRVVTPRPDRTFVPIYGGALPESSDYPPTIPDQSPPPLYSMLAGQRYTMSERFLPTDYFYDATYNYSLPDDHMIVQGGQRYYQITFNHRQGYVKATDVLVRDY